MALVGGSILLFDETTTFPSLNALVPCIGAAVIIYVGHQSWVGRALATHAIVGVGTLSYSIYLVHWPVLVFWRYLKFEELTILDRGLIIALVFVLALPMYRYIEMPLHRGARATRLPPGSVGLASVTAIAFIAATAYLPWSNGGWQFRAGDAAKNYPKLARLGEVAFRKDQYGGATTAPNFAIGFQPPQILIAGDSHSRQYFTGLSDLYPTAEHGFRVIDQGSCIFRVRRCADFDSIVQGFVAQENDGLLFVSQRWDYDKHIAVHFGQDAVGQISANTLANFYADRIAALYAIYALRPMQKIFIMGAIPEVPTFGDVATCLLRPKIFASPRNCETSNEQVKAIAFRKKLNELLSSRIAALNHKHGWQIAFGDPFQALCKSGVCEQVANNQILYNDHDHLSIDGSKRVIAAVADTLDRVLQSR